jgi:hypothetical protein
MIIWHPEGGFPSVLDMGFVWEGFFGIGLLGAAAACILAYAGIFLLHVIITSLLVSFRRRILWFILPAIVAASPLAVVHAQNVVLPHFSRLWWQDSTYQPGISRSEDETRRMTDWVSKVGHTTFFSLLILTGIGAVASTALRARTRSPAEAAGATAPISRPAQPFLTRPRGPRRCIIWIGVLWLGLLLMNVSAGILLGWSGRVYRTYEIALFLLPFVALCTNAVILILLCFWSAHLSRILAKRYAVLVAVGLCVAQLAAIVLIYLFCFAAGYAAAGRF